MPITDAILQHSVTSHRRLFARARGDTINRLIRILENLDAAALKRLHAGPDVRILLARAPEGLGVRSGALAGFITSRAEELMPPRVHPRFPRRVGFVPEIVSVRDCDTPEEGAELILQSSCTPPFTAAHRRGGRPVLDGGLVDWAPAHMIDAGDLPTLILLTRIYPPSGVPRVEGRTYVQPSIQIPVDAWDYTNPRGIQMAYDLGRRDGESFSASARVRTT